MMKQSLKDIFDEKKQLYSPSSALRTPKLDDTRVDYNRERDQIESKANIACFWNDSRDREVEKNAHKLSANFK